MKRRILICIIWFCSLNYLSSQTLQPVKMWQEPLILPTYSVNPPDPNPMFYKPASYQGARRFIYPYALMDNLSCVKTNKTYNAIYLENEYIKICILPEIGGKLFYATDKTNGYDFIYHQHVIKPANIGMFGAWISGGIEWCVFHHHRPSTFMPVDCVLKDNPDGSKTVWLGEIEPRQRMKWIVGITLYPGKSYIEAELKFINRTALPHSMLYFANAATSSNTDYQIIFPPSTDYATFHHKNSFAHWPFSKEIYNGVDYTKGVDISWWKNHPDPISFFVFNLKEDFLGGYDHAKKAGTLHWADHHFVSGAKFWQFGPGNEGQMWDKVLTDTDGPYVELMSGAFSDNQPDYSCIKPYETRTIKQYWFPLRDIGIIKNVNKQASVNLDVKGDTVVFGLNTTERFDNATVVIKENESILFKENIFIDPAHPYKKEKKLNHAVNFENLSITLFSSSNKEIITYKPIQKKYNPALPEIVSSPPKPSEIKTIEELYLTGLRIEQFHNQKDPELYYNEALKRDSCDSRVNTAMGIRCFKRADYEKAARYLRTAIVRISKNYTRPRNCEAYYQHGLTLKALGKYDDAYDTLYRATWDDAFYSSGFKQLAEISCIRHDFATALEQIDQSLQKNENNTTLLDLKCSILRKLNKLKEAEILSRKVLTIDPLDFHAANELYLVQTISGKKADADKTLFELTTTMRDLPESYLELAGDYMNCGMHVDALNILRRAIDMKKNGLSTYPMIHYYIGYIYEKLNDTQKSEFYNSASRQPIALCFPFRLESIDVLNAAIQFNDQDAHAHYLLGNNLYDWQPEKAIQEWEKATSIDKTLAVGFRNLGWGYDQTNKNNDQAITAYEKAISLDTNDAIYFYELDKLYEKKGIDINKRLTMLDNNLQTVIKRMDSYITYIKVLVQAGQYDRAIEHLTSHTFYNAEGSNMLHEINVDAHLLRGYDFILEKKYNEALNDFIAADTYPENQQIGRNTKFHRNPQIFYFTATAYEALGKTDEAKKYYEKSVSSDSKESHFIFYQGLAYMKLHEQTKADSIFTKLIKIGEEKLKSFETEDYFSSFGEMQENKTQLAPAHFMMALGYLGKGQKTQAKQEFEKAKQLNVNLFWADHFLKQLN